MTAPFTDCCFVVTRGHAGCDLNRDNHERSFLRTKPSNLNHAPPVEIYFSDPTVSLAQDYETTFNGIDEERVGEIIEAMQS